jgi:hypothetical protein
MLGGAEHGLAGSHVSFPRGLGEVEPSDVGCGCEQGVILTAVMLGQAIAKALGGLMHQVRSERAGHSGEGS